MVIALVACFSTTALAATATISPGGNASAFFSKEVNNYVYIDQKGAGNKGTAIGMLWYLYSKGNDVIGVSDYMTGATTGYVYKDKWPEDKHARLLAYNTDQTLTCYLTYSYTIY